MRRALDLLTEADRRRLVGVTGLMVATAALEAVGVGAILPFLDYLLEPSHIHAKAWSAWLYDRLGFGSDRDFLIAMGGGVLAVVVGTQAVAMWSRWTLVRFNYDLEHAISVRLLDGYLHRPYGYFLLNNTTRLNRNLLQETGFLIAGVVNPGLSLVSHGLVAAAVVGLLLVVAPLQSLALLVLVGGVYATVYLRMRRELGAAGETRNRANALRYRVATEAFGGVKELKLQGREGRSVEAFAPGSRAYTDANATAAIATALPTYVMRGLTFGGMVALLLVLLASGQDPAGAIPVLGFIAFAGYRLMPSFEGIVTSVSQFKFLEDTLHELHHDLVTDATAERDDVAPGDALPFTISLELDGIGFRYPGSQRANLEGVSLVVPKNGSIGLVGPTGAGKSTLMDVIMGLLEPQEGRIIVDGRAVEGRDRLRWRRNFGYVPQEIFLTDDTIARNIAFGVPDAEIDRGRLERAASAAHIDGFIGELPAGYGTVIGERGVRLSGGQRQRIGIARALYHDPPILAMDEATSDIDTATERLITEAIEGLSGTKTIITIAHRLSTIQRCDAIYVIEQGRIVSHGRYDELARTSPQFRRLTPMQAEIVR